MAKLWDTSAAGSGTGLDPAIDAFLSSTLVDQRLLPEDLEGSIAHAAMLGQAGILPAEIAAELGRGLAALAVGAEEGSLVVDPTAEDIHSFVEAELTVEDGRRRPQPPRGPEPQRPGGPRPQALAAQGLRSRLEAPSSTPSTRCATSLRGTPGPSCPATRTCSGRSP